MRKSTQSSERLCELKSQLRRKKREELEALPEAYIKSSDSLIAEKLFKLPEFKSAKRVFAYYSVGREVSTHRILETVLSQGKQLALPICETNGIMRFALVRSLDELGKGSYGIPEPPDDSETLLPDSDDIIIVPALCADRLNNRLGHGAGYYDRYLENTVCFSVCLCRARLLEDELPTEPTDKKVSAVLTE